MASTIRVGIVDADQTIRAGRRMVLDSAADITVVFEEDSVSRVLELFDDYLLDVLLVEQRLRGSSGIELTKALSQIKIASGNKTRILLTTVFSSPDTLLAALQVGASDVVGQDEGPEALLSKIRLLNSARPAHTHAEIETVWRSHGGKTKSDLPLTVFLDSLSATDLALLQRMIAGESGSDIAKDLGIAVYRIRKNLEFALQRLHLATLEQMQLRFISAGVELD